MKLQCSILKKQSKIFLRKFNTQYSLSIKLLLQFSSFEKYSSKVSFKLKYLQISEVVSLSSESYFTPAKHEALKIPRKFCGTIFCTSWNNFTEVLLIWLWIILVFFLNLFKNTSISHQYQK